MRVRRDLPRPDGGHRDVLVAVEVPPSPGDRERVVRMAERDHVAERALVARADVPEQRPPGRERHLLVEVQLVGPQARPGVGDRRHVVVPAGALVRAVPVRRPAEVRRIDVGGEPLLEPVQLVRAAEVHLAGQHGAVAGPPQVVGEGRDLGAELRRVVVGAGARGQQAGQERRPGRGAQRAGRVRRVEDHPGLGEPGQRRGARHRVAVTGQRRRHQLVGHDDQDVRAPASGHRAGPKPR